MKYAKPPLTLDQQADLLIDRVHRELTDEEITRLADTYRMARR